MLSVFQSSAICKGSIFLLSIQDMANYFFKGWIVNILGFAGYTVSQIFNTAIAVTFKLEINQTELMSSSIIL